MAAQRHEPQQMRPATAARGASAATAGARHAVPPEEFLQSSRYCDWNADTIQTAAQTLTAESPTRRDHAVRLFEWVRDAVMFQVGDWHYTASETLAARRGTCSNKANLLVALARAVGIPAGFHVLKVDGKHYLGPVVLPNLQKFIRTRSTHVCATLYLDERWSRCDPSDDRRFAESTVHLNPQSRLVEWNGRDDAVVRLDPAHIWEDEGPLSSIDHLLGKPRQIGSFPVTLGNFDIAFLREHGATLSSHAVLDSAFRRWLRRRAPGWYVLYCLTAVGRRR